jgi:hypothetical protein
LYEYETRKDFMAKKPVLKPKGTGPDGPVLRPTSGKVQFPNNVPPQGVVAARNTVKRLGKKADNVRAAEKAQMYLFDE